MMTFIIFITFFVSIFSGLAAILIMAEDRLKAVHQRAEKYRIPALVYRL